ncbi:MAG TPA: hypothetical protein VK065_08290, partial [Brevibacterium sp.]|nr:hypothetical protein [Brevibacterium sp.]
MEQFTSEWQAWHDDRLAALATPFGFLSITGLHWLQQGENFWEGAPGSFELDGDTIRFRIGTGRSAGPTRAALEAEGAQEVVGEEASATTQATSAATVTPATTSATAAPATTVLGTDRDGSPWIRLAKDAALSWLVAEH